jgi:hypothetical protein
MSKDTGGPAFPVAESNPQGDPNMVFAASYGMTMRDYFAAQAIPRMISLCEDRDGGWDEAAVAAGCYHLADAMLAERAKGGAA